MYGVFAYIWSVLIVNVGKYSSPTDPIGNTNVFKSQKKHFKKRLVDGSTPPVEMD